MLNRRTLLKGLCAGGAMALVPGKSWAADEEPPAKRFRVWDQHSPSPLGARQYARGARGLPGQVHGSRGSGADRSSPRATARTSTRIRSNSFKLENDRTMQAAKAFPDRIYGSVYHHAGPARLQHEGIGSLRAGTARWS